MPHHGTSAPLIVFDLDGTLIDTAPDLVATLNVVFEREGLPPVPLRDRAQPDRRRRAGHDRARHRSRRARVDQAELERMFADFIVHYTEHVADRSQPFPGVDRRTRYAQRPSVIASPFAPTSSNGSRCSCSIVWKLADRFDAICGQDTFGIQKPDPEILRRTIAAAGGNLQRALMIGDSETDIHTARAAGIPVIAVDFGYSERPVSELWPGPADQPFRAVTRPNRRPFLRELTIHQLPLWLTR